MGVGVGCGSIRGVVVIFSPLLHPSFILHPSPIILMSVNVNVT